MKLITLRVEHFPQTVSYDGVEWVITFTTTGFSCRSMIGGLDEYLRINVPHLIKSWMLTEKKEKMDDGK